MILVVGGAGYIGSHTVLNLQKNGYDVLVYDNLSTGHKEYLKKVNFECGDLSDIEKLNSIFLKYKIKTVIHFAANAYVGESIIKPDLYYKNNVCNGLVLLECMKENNVKDIIFSSSCATYGIPKSMPITEETQQNPVSPYGMTKYIFERILSDFHAAFGFNFICLRYFNAAGANVDCETGEWHIPETHVIPLILDCAHDHKKIFQIFGTDYPTKDGTCIRDYVHVDDLADAHMFAINYLSKPSHVNYINLGTGSGYSILELLSAVERLTGNKIAIQQCEKRKGDPAELIASNDLAEKELNWKPKRSSIDNIILTAWNWHKKLMN